MSIAVGLALGVAIVVAILVLHISYHRLLIFKVSMCTIIWQYRSQNNGGQMTDDPLTCENSTGAAPQRSAIL